MKISPAAKTDLAPDSGLRAAAQAAVAPKRPHRWIYAAAAILIVVGTLVVGAGWLVSGKVLAALKEGSSSAPKAMAAVPAPELKAETAPAAPPAAAQETASATPAVAVEAAPEAPAQAVQAAEAAPAAAPVPPSAAAPPPPPAKAVAAVEQPAAAAPSPTSDAPAAEPAKPAKKPKKATADKPEDKADKDAGSKSHAKPKADKIVKLRSAPEALGAAAAAPAAGSGRPAAACLAAACARRSEPQLRRPRPGGASCRLHHRHGERLGGSGFRRASSIGPPTKPRGKIARRPRDPRAAPLRPEGLLFKGAGFLAPRPSNLP